MAIFTFVGMFVGILLSLWLKITFFLLLFSSDARTMAREVKEIILETIQTEGNKSREEAESYLKKMESQKRYSADVWS